MDYIEAKVLPILYIVLLGFLIVNLILNLCLFSFTKISALKTLVLYWGSLICFSLLMGAFQGDRLSIVLSFSTSFFPMCILGKLLLEPVGIKPPYKGYVLLWIIGVCLTLISSNITTTFFGLAIPVSLTLGLILLHIAYALCFQSSYPSTRLQKFVSFLVFISFIHTINFAIFRGEEGNQIWGWATAFTTYQVLALSVLALIFERHIRRETEVLEEVVKDRTNQLSNALHMKEKLIRVVLHDIAGPIQGQTLILSRIQSKNDPEITANLLPKLSILTEIVRNVIQKVFTMEAIDSGTFQFDKTPVKLEDCIREILVVFESRLLEKDLVLNIQNELKEDSVFLADQVIFTTSVLGNLISNSIKYSLPGKTITLKATESDDQVFIDITDSGIGIPSNLLNDLFTSPQRSSRPGTLGEPGTGFGLSQAKAYLEQFDGKIEIESRAIENHPFDHGTTVHITMKKSSSKQEELFLTNVAPLPSR